MEGDPPYDLLVIGAGICGLITARDALKLGAKVKVLEASGRVGGQVWCIDHVATKKTIAFGAEWLNPLKHELMFAEFKRYNIALDSFVHKREYILYGGKGEKAKISEHRTFLSELKNDPVYINAMRTINWDVSFICFKDGYFQPESEHYDMPFIQYLTERLQALVTSAVHEFILMQVFHLTGGNPTTQSALGVLHVIAGFRTAEKAFSVDPEVGGEGELLHRYPAALSQYVKALADDIESLGGDIDFYTPVVEVRKKEVLLPPPRVPNYDYPALPDRRRTVYVKCGGAKKGEVAARAVVVAVPLKCLTSIRFDPPLPLELRQAAERCNAGVEQLKVYAFVGGISRDIGRLSTVQYECNESYTIARHHKYNAASATATTTSGGGGGAGLNAHGVLAAAAASAKMHARRTLTVTYRAPQDANDTINHTLICTNGSRHELLHNLARNLRKIYPVIELQNDKPGNTPASSRPSTSASNGAGRTKGGSGGAEGGVSSSSGVSVLSVTMKQPESRAGTNSRSGNVAATHRGGGDSTTGTTAAAQQRVELSPSPLPVTNLTESPEDVNTSEYTVSHDGAVLYHDFLTDVCIRGTWFNLRAGTAHLHVRAVRAARMPWHRNTRRSVYAASATIEHSSESASASTAVVPSTSATRTAAAAAAAAKTFVDNNSAEPPANEEIHSPENTNIAQEAEELTLIIAGAELHPEWTGWLEGAALSGALAARRVHPYLFPPMVARNYAKRVPAVSSAQLEALFPITAPSTLSPKYSPGLDRRRRML